jgi:hypothetical protein
MQTRSFRGSGEPAWVIASSNACDGLGPDPRRALGPAAIRAAQQAGHMTAPDQCCINVKKLLSIRRRPHMTRSAISPRLATRTQRIRRCRLISYSLGWIVASGWPNSTGWPSFARIATTQPAVPVSTGTERRTTSIMPIVPSACTLSPGSTNGLSPGAPRKNLPTVFDLSTTGAAELRRRCSPTGQAAAR